VTHCNRGGELLRTDDAGLEQQVSCETVRAQYEKVRERQEKLRDYLDRGLVEECRRAGCQPGWLR
jgi:hypothetical protein